MKDEEFKKLFSEASEVCKACQGELKYEKINLEEYEGGKLYILEGVPALVCQSCGEIWVPKSFMDEFEKMIEASERKQKKRKKK